MARKKQIWLVALAMIVAVAALSSFIEAPKLGETEMQKPTNADRKPAPSPGAAVATLPDPPSSASRAARPGDPAAVPLPGPDVPLDQTIATLEPLAAQGRVDAMRALGGALYRCRIADRGSDEEVRQRQIDRLLSIERDLRNGERFVNATEAAQSMIDTALRVRDECSTVDAARSARWIGWIERAAASGDTGAMLEYVGLAFRDGEGGRPLSIDDEFERRRQLASTYLRQALEAGDCRALMELERQYAGEAGVPLVEPDAAVAYAYLYARWLWEGEAEPGRPPDDDTGWAAYKQQHAKELDSAQVASATQRGTALYGQYCRGRAPRTD